MKNNILLLTILIVLTIAFFITQTPKTFSYDDTNVTTRVNVTTARPEVLGVTIQSYQNITLNQGTTRTVMCNATIRDYNGYADINITNATLFSTWNSSFGGSDDKNNHYTNTSCALIAGAGVIGNYSWNFEVYYYAVNGTWNCTVYVNDTLGYTGHNQNTTYLNPLYALNLTDLINYGNLAQSAYSDNITVNITNFGNMNINVTVAGFGSVQNDGLAMVCAVRNITLSNEKYTIVPNTAFASKTTLTGTSTQTGLTILKQWQDSVYSENSTYWELYVDPTNNPFGICNGTILFAATAQ
jgi:hypothetical protein